MEVSISTRAGLRLQRFLDMIWPDVLNACSDEALEPQMHKYFFAKMDKSGYVDAYSRHHS